MADDYAHFCSNLRYMHWYVVCAPTLLGGIAAILTFRWNLRARGALPMSALLRTQNVFLILGCGLSGGFQALRPLSDKGCGVDEKYLILGAVPMLAGAKFPTIPEWLFRFASSLEAYLTGITVLSLLLVEPRLRHAFNPLQEAHARSARSLARSSRTETVLSWLAGAFLSLGFPLWVQGLLASLPPIDQEVSEGPSVKFNFVWWDEQRGWLHDPDKDWSYFFWTVGDLAGFLFGLALALVARRRERSMLAYLAPPSKKTSRSPELPSELVGPSQYGRPPSPPGEAGEPSGCCCCCCDFRRRAPLFPVFAATSNPVLLAFAGLRTFRILGALAVFDIASAEYLNGFATQLICCIAMVRYADAARPLRDPVFWLSMQHQEPQTSTSSSLDADGMLTALACIWPAKVLSMLYSICMCTFSLFKDTLRMLLLFPLLTLLPGIGTRWRPVRELLGRMGLKSADGDKHDDKLLVEFLFLISESEIEKGRRAWLDWQLMLSHKDTSLTIGFSWPAGQEDLLAWKPSPRPRRCWLNPFSWGWVIGDLFSDRIRTPDVTALFFTVALIRHLWDGSLYKIMDNSRCDLNPTNPEKVSCPGGSTPGLSGVVSLLTAIVRLIFGWVLLSLFMFGNNVLLNRAFARVWYALVSTWSGLYLLFGPFLILGAIDRGSLPDASVLWPQPAWVEYLSYLALFYWLFESAARVLFSPLGARNSAAYRVETMARLYCRELLKGHETSGRSAWAAREYYENRIVPALQEEEEFTMVVDRTAGRDLGVRWDSELRIEAVTTGGLVQQWNETHRKQGPPETDPPNGVPELVLKPGDRIVGVNGVRGDVLQLLGELSQNKTLELVVKRSQAEFMEKISRRQKLKSGKFDEVVAVGTAEEFSGRLSDDSVELQPGQIHDVNFGGDSRPCLIREVVADGTCTLVTEGGEELRGVLAKQLTPTQVTNRAIGKASFSDVLRRAAGQFGSAIDRVRLEADRQKHKVRKSVGPKLRKSPPPRGRRSSHDDDEAWTPPEGAEDVPLPSTLSASSSKRKAKMDEEMDLDEESKKYLDKCKAGNNYQRSVDSSNDRRRKFRELFSTNVGYPVLVLMAIYGSGLFVALTSLTMAMKTTQLSRAVEVGRLKAVAALRITIGGLLCDSDETAWEQTWRGGSYEECVRWNGDPAICMKYGPLLFDAHDYDLNRKLDDAEVLELVHMVHEVLLVRVAEGRSSVALLENEIMDIAIQVKSGGVTAAANGTVEPIECADDNATAIATAANSGYTISGCHDWEPYCEDQAHGSAIRGICPETCGVCTENSSTAESIECADDNPTAIALAAESGSTISGCLDWFIICEDEAHGSEVRRICPETCGVCTADSGNGTESSSVELGCVDHNVELRAAMATLGYDLPNGCTDVREWCESSDAGEWFQRYCPHTCGTCHWDHADTSTFVCNVSQAVAAKEAAGGGFSESVAPLFIFTLLDQPPKDGYLTRDELQQLTPLLAMAGPELAPTFQQLLDRGFALADNDPRDQRLSQAEAGKLISDLQKMIPRLQRLFNAIVCVAAGAECEEALTGALLLDVLDLDGDGRVSKAEVNMYVMVLEAATGSPHLGPVANDFVRAADADGDGYLDEAELDEVAYRTTVLLNVMRDPSPENLRALLDRDGDGQVSPEELEGIVDVMPCPTSTAMSGVEAGSSAAVGPTPAPMSDAELGVFSDTVGEATPQCALDAGLTARRLRTPPEAHRAPPRPPAAEARRLTESWATGSAWEEVTAQLAALVDSLLRIAKTDEFRIIAPLVILGTRVAILGGLFLAINSIYRATTSLNSMVQNIQGGGKSYSGAGLRESFRGSFSASAAFPGCFIVLTLLAFFVGTCMTFVAVVSLVTPIVLFIIPTTQPLIMYILNTFVFPFLTVFLVKFVLKAIVVDKFLIYDGEIRAPPIFAPLWYVLVMLNIVWAAFTVPLRFTLSVFGALYTSTLIHQTIFPERFVKFLDPCYSAYLAIAFTQSNRRNLVRRCFLTLLIPYLHVASPPAPPTREEVDDEERRRKKRIRNKFWVLVTLFNNPELKQYRRRTLQKEMERLKVLKEEKEPGGTPSGTPGGTPSGTLGGTSTPSRRESTNSREGTTTSL